MIGIAIANSIGSRRSSGSVVVVPVATAATGVGQTSFTANWNAFVGASYYLLDVSTSSSFSSFVGSYQNFVVISNSQVVSGLTSNTTYYYRLRAATGVDADAASFFSRVYTAGGALSYTEVSATETLVASLKANSLWTSMKAVYPMVGASAAACAQNLKSSSFTGTFSSGWTFASTGVTPNGTSAYMDTGLNALSNLTLTSTHLSAYVRNNTLGSQYDLGCSADISAYSNATALITRYFNNTSYIEIGGGGYGTSTSMSNSQGFTFGTTNGSRVQNLYKNGTLIVSSSSNANNFANKNVYLGAINGGGTPTFFSDKQYALCSIGDGLDATQQSNFYTAVQTFNQTLNRQIAP